jgi:hypothetical protein
MRRDEAKTRQDKTRTDVDSLFLAMSPKTISKLSPKSAQESVYAEVWVRVRVRVRIRVRG